METNKNNNQNHEHSKKQDQNESTKPDSDNTPTDAAGYADDTKYTSPDKYLAMDQPGVSYTPDKDHVSNSDFLELDNEEDSGKWKANSQNSRNADAFSQDDYILQDNIDLDEDQSQSISSEDDLDTNTTDETL